MQQRDFVHINLGSFIYMFVLENHNGKMIIFETNKEATRLNYQPEAYLPFHLVLFNNCSVTVLGKTIARNTSCGVQTLLKRFDLKIFIGREIFFSLWIYNLSI